jgi:hypothetical protein
VQSGGSFDIDFDIKDPNQKVLLDGERERQGDYVLTANTPGEYSFCFENDMSTLTDKLVDFDIMVESEPRREAPAKPGQIAEHTSALEESVFRLNGMLMNIKRIQKQCVEFCVSLWSRRDWERMEWLTCIHSSATTHRKTVVSQSSNPHKSTPILSFSFLWIDTSTQPPVLVCHPRGDRHHLHGYVHRTLISLCLCLMILRFLGSKSISCRRSSRRQAVGTRSNGGLIPSRLNAHVRIYCIARFHVSIYASFQVYNIQRLLVS